MQATIIKYMFKSRKILVLIVFPPLGFRTKEIEHKEGRPQFIIQSDHNLTLAVLTAERSLDRFLSE